MSARQCLHVLYQCSNASTNNLQSCYSVDPYQNLLCVAALDSPTADLRDELKEQAAEEAAQKANPAQPKTPDSFKKAPSPLSNDHAANGAPLTLLAEFGPPHPPIPVPLGCPMLSFIDRGCTPKMHVFLSLHMQASLLLVVLASLY